MYLMISSKILLKNITKNLCQIEFPKKIFLTLITYHEYVSVISVNRFTILYIAVLYA